MSYSIEIRRFRPADEAEIIELVRELQIHELDMFDRMLPPERIGGWYVDWALGSAREAEGDLIVAELDGRIAGYATLYAHLTSEEDRDEVAYAYAYVGDLVVSHGARGKGIGKRLLTECEDMARRAGRKWLRISVLAANEGAHRLYKSVGFSDHLVKMEKPLS
jgi:ribosomal protein S18 acetylase RimI-like enzyme